MKCEECGAEKMAYGCKLVNIPTDDGSGVDVLVSVWYCNECDYCDVDTESV